MNPPLLILRRIALGLIAAIALAGCAASSTYRPMQVQVRDHLSGEPVADALVEVRSVNFFIPADDVPLLGHQPMLDGNPPRPDRATTDSQGVAHLAKMIVDHPVQVRVLARGYEPVLVNLSEHPLDSGPTTWMDPLADSTVLSPTEHPRLELRFVP